MKILVPAPTRGAPEGRVALARAAQEAARTHATLILVGYVPNPSGEQAAAQFPRERRRVLDECVNLARALEREHGIEVDVQVPVGPVKPSKAVLAVAAREAVDLVVIALRPRSRVGKALLGSTAQDILLGAEAPVLTVKAAEDWM